MPIVTINGKEINAPAGATVLQVALDNGIYIPHFCYHPCLSIAGNCRMCVVEVAGRPKLEVSCNLPVADGLVVSTDTEAVKKARRSVLEFLLINHPLDCPICDQAGECYLQDYHFKYSGAPSRFKEKKVRKPKVVDIGPYIMLDDERCVLCTRCVRFCKEFSRSHELAVAMRGDRSYITTAPGRKLDNLYSLNAVDICPVGALTSKDFRFKKRVWFLRSTPSVCPYCANGCPIWIDHEGGIMYRWRPRLTEKVPPFICDAGRLSYREWQGDGRLMSPLVKGEGGLITTDVTNAISAIKMAFKGCKGETFVGIASAICSCEEIDSFVKFLWEGIGSTRVYRSLRRSLNEDNILIKADKNPNTKYLADVVGLNSIPQDVNGDVLFVLDSLTSDELMTVVNFRWKLIVQITHDRSLIVPGVDVVLPRATFAEMDGTFVNYKGVKQGFCRAFYAKGDARSVIEWISLLA